MGRLSITLIVDWWVVNDSEWRMGVYDDERMVVVLAMVTGSVGVSLYR